MGGSSTMSWARDPGRRGDRSEGEAVPGARPMRLRTPSSPWIKSNGVRPAIHPARTAALLLAAATGLPDGAAAQEPRNRYALVSPNVVCREAPSHSAKVAGFLRRSGSEGGTGWSFQVLGGKTSDSGEVWIHLWPRQAYWARLSVDCWIPESALTPIGGHSLTDRELLRVTGLLLSSPEVLTLEDWVAAHNLFLNPWEERGVEESAELNRRHLEVLRRALQVLAAEEGPVVDHRDLDPLVLAWLESLGDELRFLPGRSGWAWTVGSGGLEVPDERYREDRRSGNVTQAGELAIIAFDVLCDERPSSETTVWAKRLPLDYHFSTGRADTTVGGEAWTFVRERRCWVPRSTTAPGDTDEHVLAIADRFLSSSEGRSIENFLRVHNLLSSRRWGHFDMVAASPILGLRRLDLLQSWLYSSYRTSVDPLALAVIRSLDEEVRGPLPGGYWSLRDSAFLELHERHRGKPMAQEVLWRLAVSPAFHDCEGGFACDAAATVMERMAKYWAEYPRGPRVAEAVARARKRLEEFLKGCEAARGAADGSWQSRWYENVGWERDGAAMARKIRASLREVRDAQKAPMVEFLDALEGCAREVGKG